MQTAFPNICETMSRSKEFTEFELNQFAKLLNVGDHVTLQVHSVQKSVPC